MLEPINAYPLHAYYSSDRPALEPLSANSLHVAGGQLLFHRRRTGIPDPVTAAALGL